MTKKQSQIIQGIAILFMIYHHFFLSPEQSASWLSYGNIEFVRHLAWFGKICVGLFCFVSGYGLFHTLSRLSHDRMVPLLTESYRNMLLRLLHLYCKFWCVLLIFKGIDFLLYREKFDLLEFIGNMTGICVTYNGTWWFLLQYVEMLLLLPLLDLLCTRFSSSVEARKKHITFAVLMTVVMCVCLFLFLFHPQSMSVFSAVKNQLRPAFLMVFISGYFFARQNVFTRVEQALSLRGKVFLTVCSVLSLVVAVAVRFLITRDAAFAALDFVLVPLFIFGSLQLLEHSPFLSKLFARFGQISVWLWLMHICVYSDTVDIFRYLAQQYGAHGTMPSILFYLAEVIISSACSLLFELAFCFLEKRT